MEQSLFYAQWSCHVYGLRAMIERRRKWSFSIVVRRFNTGSVFVVFDDDSDDDDGGGGDDDDDDDDDEEEEEEENIVMIVNVGLTMSVTASALPSPQDHSTHDVDDDNGERRKSPA